MSKGLDAREKVSAWRVCRSGRGGSKTLGSWGGVWAPTSTSALGPKLSGLFPTPVSRAEYECFQIELSKNYGMAEWREDVKKVLLKAGLHNLPITFLFSDTQVPPPRAVGRSRGASWKVLSPLCPGHCQWSGSWEGQMGPDGVTDGQIRCVGPHPAP